MKSHEVFEQLREFSDQLRAQCLPVPHNLIAPSEEEIQQVEIKLGIALPPSYRAFLTECPNIYFGPYPLLCLGTLLDAVEHSANHGISKNLVPFVEDNSDFFCFDTSTQAPEYQVVYWSHNGWGEERWENFLAWCELCWIAEELESREEDKEFEEE